MKSTFRESRRDSVLQPRVVESSRLPWVAGGVFPQPQRGCVRNPVGVDGYSDLRSQGSRCAPTLGWMPLPRWGNAAKTPPEVLAHGHHSVERQIAATVTFRSRTIDRLVFVYDLYGLSDDEINIVEGTI